MHKLPFLCEGLTFGPGSESRSRWAFLLSEIHGMSAQGHREAVGAQVGFVEGLIKACRLGELLVHLCTASCY